MASPPYPAQAVVQIIAIRMYMLTAQEGKVKSRKYKKKAICRRRACQRSIIRAESPIST